jgi:3'-phosphoadenosine 5'-phosphosulfate (PAPS) 3'-phosphatase
MLPIATMTASRPSLGVVAMPECNAILVGHKRRRWEWRSKDGIQEQRHD